MTGIVIFDKGTLVKPVSGPNVKHPRDQKIRVGADKGVQDLHERGMKLAMAYNEAAIETGQKTIEAVVAECRYALALFPQIELATCSPTSNELNCWMILRDEVLEVQQCSPPEYPDFEFDGPFRKPGRGMLVLIHRYFDKPPLSECWMIGNSPEDEQASEAFGCNFMAGDVWRSHHLLGFHQLSVDVPGLEFLEPSLKGMYRV